MHLSGTPDEIMQAIRHSLPEVDSVLERVRSRVPAKKRQIYEYQAAALYAAVKPYNVTGAQILEIGTFIGYSAAIMAEAAPLAQIVTLNPREDEVALARQYLQPYPTVRVQATISWEFLIHYQGPLLDVIFVDGDHAKIARDIPWWDWIAPGGLFIHHDYSPPESARPCPPVYETLNHWARVEKLAFDVLVVDHEQVGLAGFLKR